MALYQADYIMLRLLKYGPMVRRGDGWRFGTRRIADSVVARLVAHGKAICDGQRVVLAEQREVAE